MQSAWFGDSVIEVGSCIDKNQAPNSIIQSVINDGLMERPKNQADPCRGLLARSDGSAIPYPISFEVYTILKDILACANAMESSGESRESKITLIGSRIEQEVRFLPERFKNDGQRLFYGLACAVMNKSSHDSHLIRTSDFGDFIQIPGSRIKVPLGHFGEINTMYQSLPKGSVMFGKMVVKIKWGGVTNAFPRAVILCEDGTRYEADFVIITLPLGVLKQLSDTLFCPGLPAVKTNAILKIPIQHSNKVFVQFPDPFWMWGKDLETVFDPHKLRCQCGWMSGVSSIEPLAGSDHIMSFNIKGAKAQSLNSVSDKEILGDIVKFLEQTYKKVPQPVNLKRSNWSSDCHFLGANSHAGGCVRFDDFYDLASPLPEYSEDSTPVLLFAGEATHPVLYGTTKGARASGIREAERVLHLIKLHEENERVEEIVRNCVRLSI